ncbi:phage tail tube assembly chaperone [uncultured Lactobacillus sp.]|uniref:phage tail tube assembly chaperone n=1 Tax=uncultured Lactobacillus sp. TaxID=153152 RepID=UPI0025CC3D6E|nr:phage tail tube assembly chaperone [uncultured Lactobacillus sp.]
MSVKINGKKLHLTTFEVPTSGKNMRMCLVAQRDLAKESESFDAFNKKVDALKKDEELDSQTLIDFYDAQIKLIDTYSKFLKPILNLTDEQTKKLEDSDFKDVVDLANEVIAKVLGLDTSKSTDTK